jgi:hypothetical protein
MNRFAIVEAYYCFFMDYHGGQDSREYERMSKMGRYFHPRPNLSYDTLEEDAREIYDRLAAQTEQGFNNPVGFRPWDEGAARNRQN